MATPFLMDFTTRLVPALVAREFLELRPGSDEQVAVYLANHLAVHGKGRSLLSVVLQGLYDCELVEDVFCDDDELKDVMEGLRYPT